MSMMEFALRGKDQQLVDALDAHMAVVDKLPGLRTEYEKLKKALADQEELGPTHAAAFEELGKAKKTLQLAEETVDKLPAILKHMLGHAAHEFLAETGKPYIAKYEQRRYRIEVARDGSATVHRN